MWVCKQAPNNAHTRARTHTHTRAYMWGSAQARQLIRTYTHAGETHTHTCTHRCVHVFMCRAVLRRTSLSNRRAGVCGGGQFTPCLTTRSTCAWQHSARRGTQGRHCLGDFQSCSPSHGDSKVAHPHGDFQSCSPSHGNSTTCLQKSSSSHAVRAPPGLPNITAASRLVPTASCHMPHAPRNPHQHLAPRTHQHLAPRTHQHLTPRTHQHLAPRTHQHLAPRTHQHLACFRALQVLRQLHAQCLLQARHHADALPGPREVNLDGRLVVAIGVVLDLVGALRIGWARASMCVCAHACVCVYVCV